VENTGVWLTVESDFRVSFFFNDNGQELKRKRYVGRKAGQI
jgi:hypothetical protein